MATPSADEEWLTERIQRILLFYYPDCLDDDHGGYIAQLDTETGEIYDADSKHLVATSRFVVNFSLAARHGGPEWALPAAEHGVSFLREHHRDPDTGGYDWLLRGTETVDDRRVCYGHAFVLLAYARAHEAGIDGAKTALEDTYDLLVDHFWEPGYDLCKSGFSADFAESDACRGQNANMHTCEAMLAAFESTGPRSCSQPRSSSAGTTPTAAFTTASTATAHRSSRTHTAGRSPKGSVRPPRWPNGPTATVTERGTTGSGSTRRGRSPLPAATGTKNSSTASPPKPDRVRKSNRATTRSGPVSRGFDRSTTDRHEEFLGSHPRFGVGCDI